MVRIFAIAKEVSGSCKWMTQIHNHILPLEKENLAECLQLLSVIERRMHIQREDSWREATNLPMLSTVLGILSTVFCYSGSCVSLLESPINSLEERHS